ncbi:MAG: rhomboid family intramembrane serine protease [Bacteroidales bacterium]|nr:rhomboid family intramembrane serine protease [Bacteroidales bacterium]
MTYLILAVTIIVSIIAMNNKALFYKLQFNAYQVVHRKQWYRLLSHGLIHAGWWHLAINMFVLWSFGTAAEGMLIELSNQGIIQFPILVFILLYVTALVVSSSISLVQHKDNHWYNAVGASGAVSAILYFSIFFQPMSKIYLYGALGIPGIIFGVLYVVYSQYMARKGEDNIGHEAHLLGAVYGFVFPLFMGLELFMEYFWKGIFG